MLFTLSGIVILVRFLHPLNTLSSKYVTAALNSTAFTLILCGLVKPSVYSLQCFIPASDSIVSFPALSITQPSPITGVISSSCTAALTARTTFCGAVGLSDCTSLLLVLPAPSSAAADSCPDTSSCPSSAGFSTGFFISPGSSVSSVFLTAGSTAFFSPSDSCAPSPDPGMLSFSPDSGSAASSVTGFSTTLSSASLYPPPEFSCARTVRGTASSTIPAISTAESIDAMILCNRFPFLFLIVMIPPFCTFLCFLCAVLSCVFILPNQPIITTHLAQFARFAV